MEIAKYSRQLVFHSGFFTVKGDDEVDGEVEEEVSVSEEDIIAVPNDKVITTYD